MPILHSTMLRRAVHVTLRTRAGVRALRIPALVAAALVVQQLSAHPLAAQSSGQGTGQGTGQSSAQSGLGDTARATTPTASTADPLRGNPSTLSALSAQARAQQDAFERNHRQGLRFYNGGADATCEVPLGRICYWNNNGDVPPPAERSDAKIEREQLLDMLARAQQADPKDDWVSGMRVRYAIEGQKPDVALEAARACGGTTWWCHALEGLALQNADEWAASQVAFARALEAMPAAQRCEWTDLTPWLEPASQTTYKTLGCDNRAAYNTKVLRLAQPLWMLPGNDVANELYARHTMSRVHSLARIPYDMQWGNDLLESQLRYGWPMSWSVQNGGVADPRPPQVIGHEPTPSYDFMPVHAAIENPVAATAEAWDPKRKRARMRYATRYAAGFGELPNQFARFKRGDTTLVAGGFRLMRELEMGRAPYNAGLTLDALDGSAPVQVTKEDAGANRALLAPMTRPMLASLEVLAPTGKRAARVRTAVQPLPADTRLSDFLLLQRGDPSLTPSLERNAEQAYGSLDIVGGTQIGLYWETYRQSSPSAPLQVSLRATRLGASFMQRLGGSIGLSKALTPVSMRFNDNGRPDGGAGRSLTLNFPSVPAGDYRLTLIVSGAGITDSTTQTIRVRSER